MKKKAAADETCFSNKKTRLTIERQPRFEDRD
jgi:hypothetical protein